ncbi:uncharacterized protein LOC143603535 [Bidens hawaiensis]|uniref:uncharacterized protein LOC143603535 n=1 Tax=Bidens hawaiensis TaxID=980011 RepID=UPI004049599A
MHAFFKYIFFCIYTKLVSYFVIAFASTQGTENLLGLALDMKMLEKEMLSGSLQLKTDALSKMDNLKLLQLNHVNINGSYKNISKELRWLRMHGFCLKSLPSELPMEKVVVLDMSHSNIESFDMSYSRSQRFVSRLKGVVGSNSKNKQYLLGSLKILDLSFCEQLRSLHGFFELPILEKLIIANCTSLIQVSKSIEHCVELVFVDLSHCKKLKKLPRTIGKLKKLKTLLSNGCELLVFPIELIDMDSLQRLEADNIGINSQISCSAGMGVIPRDTRSFMSNLPISLVHLSLKNSNLSNKSFPMDFSSLIVLKKLYLDGNPIVSLPSCVRTLPRLELLSMAECAMLKTVARPPPTLTVLSLTSHSEMSQPDSYMFYPQAKHRNSVNQILFHPQMSLLRLELPWQLLGNSSFEIEGMVKIQCMADVEEKVLLSLGWTYLRPIQDQQVKTSHLIIEALETNVQLYYEFGIFSTFYWGKEIPNWVECRSNGSSISFTIPSSPKKLRGLNFWFLQKYKVLCMDSVPFIVIRNRTKNQTWIYDHYIPLVNVAEECMIFLSHWMFGKEEIEDGDQLTITIGKKDENYNCMEAECGIGLVYDEGEKNEEEDALSYYKSWNHIISGELFSFQLTTGEYILNHYFLRRYDIFQNYGPFVADGARAKGGINFRAFSQPKSDSVGGESDVHELCGP